MAALRVSAVVVRSPLGMASKEPSCATVCTLTSEVSNLLLRQPTQNGDIRRPSLVSDTCAVQNFRRNTIAIDLCPLCVHRDLPPVGIRRKPERRRTHTRANAIARRAAAERGVCRQRGNGWRSTKDHGVGRARQFGEVRGCEHASVMGGGQVFLVGVWRCTVRLLGLLIRGKLHGCHVRSVVHGNKVPC